MNNKNWIAVFFGLACLVLFVSVMGASGNWLNNDNNGTTPQQINQTVREMDNNTKSNNNTPTKIDATEITDTLTDSDKNSNSDSNSTNKNTNQDMPNLMLPKMGE